MPPPPPQPPAAAAASSVAIRGTIHDNPWAGVERTNQQDNETEEEENNNNTTTTSNRRRRRRRIIVLHEGFWLQCLDILLQIWWCVDVLAALLAMIGSAYLFPKESDSSTTTRVVGQTVLTTLAVLYGLRVGAVAAGLALPSDSLWSCRRGGLILAAVLSVVCGMELVLGVVWALINAKDVRHFLQNHNLHFLSQAQRTWLVTHYAVVLVLLFVMALLEGLKWPVYRIYRRSLLQWEDEQENLENQQLIRRSAASGRPWWWNHPHSRHRGNVQLTQALLADDEPGSLSPRRGQQRRQRRGLLALFQRSNNNHTETSAMDRDDGSVDFASVQEEWASRAEEDPVWWSREDDEAAMGNVSHISRVDVDTSWAQEQE